MWRVFWSVLVVLLHETMPDRAGEDIAFPGYHSNISNLFVISDRQQQEFLANYWLMPFADNNAAFIEWDFGGNKQKAATLIVWCVTKGWLCKFAFLNPVAQRNHNEWQPTVLTQPRHICLKSGDECHPLNGEDMRLIRHPSTFEVFAMYSKNHATQGHHFKHMFYGKLIYDEAQDRMYIERHSLHKISIEHEVGFRHQKNWFVHFKIISICIRREENHHILM